MISYNLLDSASRHMLSGVDTFEENDIHESIGTANSPTKSLTDGRRARLTKYFGLPALYDSSPTSNYTTRSRLVSYRTHEFNDDYIDDVFDLRTDQQALLLTNESDSSCCDSPSAQVMSISKMSDLSTKIKIWRLGRKHKLSDVDIPLWFQRLYNYRRARKSFRLHGPTTTNANKDHVSVDIDSMFECYKEYKASKSHSKSSTSSPLSSSSSPSTLSSPLASSYPGSVSSTDGLDQSAILEEFNFISHSIPPFSPMNTLSYEGIEELRREIFGNSFLSDSNSAFDIVDVETPVKSPLNHYELLDSLPSYISPSIDDNYNSNHKTLPHFKAFLHEAKRKLTTSVSTVETRTHDSNQVNEVEASSHSVDNEPEQPITPDSASSNFLSFDSPTLFNSPVDGGGDGSSKSGGSSSHPSTITSTSCPTSSSSFSMCTVTIPTERSSHFLSMLAETILEGGLIESIYHPEGTLVPMDYCEDTIMDITNPNSFDITDHLAMDTSDMNSSTTIKFRKFAHLLLYDNTGRLKRGPSINKKEALRRIKMIPKYDTTVVERTELFKQRCSLRLYDQPARQRQCQLQLQSTDSPPRLDGLIETYHTTVRLSQSCRLAFPKFSTWNDQSGQCDPHADATTHSSCTRSILKSKTNDRCDEENQVASECDNFPVKYFMDIVGDSEKLRQEQLPQLDKRRKLQVDHYYDSLGPDDMCLF